MPVTKSKTISNPLRLLLLTPVERSSPTSPNGGPALLLPPLLQALTSSAPPPDLPTFSGYTSHPPLQLRTKYYDADVPIWVDEIPPSFTSHYDEPSDTAAEEDEGSGAVTLTVWKDQMLSIEAREVLEAIGGLILLLPADFADLKPVGVSPDTDPTAYLVDLVSTVSDIRDEIESVRAGSECAACVVLQSTPDVISQPMDAATSDKPILDRFEETLLNQGILGWDVVVWDGADALTTTTQTSDSTKGEGEDGSEERNVYGEKTGIPRLREILEAVEWQGTSLSLDDDDDDDTGNDPSLSFLSAKVDSALAESGSDDQDPLEPDEQELQREMLGLSMAIRAQSQRQDGEDDEDEQEDNSEEKAKVDALPALMERVVAIREKGAALRGEERERYARRAVGEIMKEL